MLTWKYTIGAISVLALAAAAQPQDSAKSIRSNEYEAVALIVKEELKAGGTKPVHRLCLSVPQTGLAPKRLVKFLQNMRLPVKNRNGCYPHSLTEGLSVDITKIERSGEGQLLVTVTASEMEVGEDLGTLLRNGVYVLAAEKEGPWRVISYRPMHPSGADKKPAQDCPAPSP